MKKEKRKNEYWKEAVNKDLVIKLPRGVKEHIRHEKKRIRNMVEDPNERKDMIEKLYNNFSYFVGGEGAKNKEKSKKNKK